MDARPVSHKPDLMSLSIGRRLRRRRRDLGATLQEIAGRAGLSYQQIQRLERGETEISAAVVWKLAAALGVSISFLFGDLSEPAGPTGADPSAVSSSGKAHRSAPPGAG